MPEPTRTVFFISDSTGITAETIGHSLLAQFAGIHFTPAVIPFVDTVEKARDCVARIEAAKAASGHRPLVFTTLIDKAVRDTVRKADAFMIDFLERSLHPLEAELGVRSSHTVGRHNVEDSMEYQQRIEAVNFALACDDGVAQQELVHADVILIGVSRSGKTPTCLYLALQLGIKAANYPLIPDDFERGALPAVLERHAEKLYGLTIEPERLARIRTERRPGSRYASLENCRTEVEAAERLMRKYGVQWINSTTRSIEEIAIKILQEVRVERRVY